MVTQSLGFNPQTFKSWSHLVERNKHFLQVWLGKFDKRSKQFPFGDHFIDYHKLLVMMYGYCQEKIDVGHSGDTHLPVQGERQFHQEKTGNLIDLLPILSTES